MSTIFNLVNAVKLEGIAPVNELLPTANLVSFKRPVPAVTLPRSLLKEPVKEL